jgi:hypothetical protein
MSGWRLFASIPAAVVSETVITWILSSEDSVRCCWLHADSHYIDSFDQLCIVNWQAYDS